ncbi:MAG TPA: YgjV family protein [Thermoanaerobaculia bacterium]|nr:YgjV family protein [Thermoanaerobaculia bacterium]
MHTPLALELLGYAASVLIAASLTMRSITRLRRINLAGALTFAIYGFLIGAYPVCLLNLLTASINVIQLVRLRRRREIFRILEISPTSEYLGYFLQFESKDIRKFVPEFRFDPEATNLVIFVLRDLIPAGLLLGDIRDGALRVHLDYAVPQYRDLKIGNFLFVDQADYFRGHGVREILSPAGNEEHSRYLENMGFTPAGDEQNYRLTL